MSEVTFPPANVVPYSARREQLLACRFIKVRQAATDIYKNPDKTSLMDYNSTLHNRDGVYSKVLDFELAQGWLTDDRSNAQVITHPAVQNGDAVSANGSNGSSNGAMQAPVPIQQFQPQPIASPAQAVAVAQVVAIPPPQDAAPAAPTSGFKRPAPKILNTAVAPPPLAMAAPVPQAAPVAPVVMEAPKPPPGAVVLQAPVAPVAPVVAPATAPVAQTVATQVDLGPVITRIDQIGKGLGMVSEELDKQKSDFKTFVGNLSGQTSETNKALAAIAGQLSELKKTQDLLMTAVHHIYLSTGQLGQAAGQEGTALPGFKTFLSKYLPQ